MKKLSLSLLLVITLLTFSTLVFAGDVERLRYGQPLKVNKNQHVESVAKPVFPGGQPGMPGKGNLRNYPKAADGSIPVIIPGGSVRDDEDDDDEGVPTITAGVRGAEGVPTLTGRRGVRDEDEDDDEGVPTITAGVRGDEGVPTITGGVRGDNRMIQQLRK